MTGLLRKYWTLATMVVIILLATFLRFHRIDYQSFWNDEGNSARLSERSVSLIIEGTASDIHPPLYYLMLRGWREIAGDSEFGLRIFSAMLGIILVAATYAVSRNFLGRDSELIAVTAALVAAANPSLVYYSQEARMYEMLALLAVLSALLLIRLLKESSRRPLFAALYGICIAVGLYTHYFFPVFIVVQLLFVIIWFVTQNELEIPKRLRFLVPIAAGLALALLLYLPWIPINLRQAFGRATERTALIDFVVDAWDWLLLGGFTQGGTANWYLTILAILAILGLVLLARKPESGVQNSAGLVLFAFVPLAAMWILGSTRPSFFKFMLLSVPWIALMLAAGVWFIWRRLNARFVPIIGIVFIAAVIWFFAGFQRETLWNLYYDPEFARADYRGIAERIAADDHPSAAVILNAANQWEVFTYYYPEDSPDSALVVPIPRGQPDPGKIDRALSELTAEHSRIYALFWGEAERDPQRLVERWLDDNAFKATDEWVSDVRFVTYAISDDEMTPLEQENGLRFGEDIVLDRFEIGANSLSAGEILPVSLYWKSSAEIDERYKVFLHLVDSMGRIVTQRDSEPGGGLALTTTWNPGETVEDNHGLLLPNDITAGDYRLNIGMYPIGDPDNRLVIFSQDGEQDSYTLTTIAIPRAPG